ncbi:MAG: hypothetical protein ACOX5W_10400 [Bacillota bacterium]|jgi:hypothetical protein
MTERWRGNRWIHYCLVLTGVLVLVFSWLRNPGTIRSAFYTVFREGSRIALDFQHRGQHLMESEHFRVRYGERDAEAAALVLAIAEEIYDPINQNLGYEPNRKVPIIIYPTNDSLTGSFGWPADEGALGVYWVGSIRILSPSAWATSDEGKIDPEIFRTTGPISHEYTHYVIDYLTGGNYPRWFTEGVAQWEEKKLTGFAFSNPFTELYQQSCRSSQQRFEPKSIAEPRGQEWQEWVYQELYPLKEMDTGFDYLPNQMLAYWESLMAVKYINTVYSSECLSQIIKCLSQGEHINQALKQTTGADLAQFDADFRAWAADQAARESIAHNN